MPSKLCQRCHERPGKIVHHKIHITPFNINNPMITLSFKNLEYVCQECHNEEHMHRGAIKKGLIFDEEGNIIEEKIPPREKIN